MARLSKQQWAEARAKWEADPREGYDWLANELGNVVSRQAISKTANKEGWTKGGSKVSQKVAQPKKQEKESCATKTKVAQPEGRIKAIQDEEEKTKVKELIDVIQKNSKYDQRFNRLARKFCLMGATDEDLAELFEVSVATIHNWKLQHPKFLDAIKRGKAIADANMAYKLYHRGIGYSHPETKVFCNNGEIITAEVMKHYPPDTKASLAWLYNRQPDKWRNKVDVQGGIAITPIPYDELREITRQAVESAAQRHKEIIEGRYERLGITKDYQSD